MKNLSFFVYFMVIHFKGVLKTFQEFYYFCIVLYVKIHLTHSKRLKIVYLLFIVCSFYVLLCCIKKAPFYRGFVFEVFIV